MHEKNPRQMISRAANNDGRLPSYCSVTFNFGGGIDPHPPFLWLVKKGWKKKLCSWGNWAVGQGAMVMRLKTIGHGWGGHSCKPSPYSSWLSSIKALKLVKAVAGLEKVILACALSSQAWHQGTRSTKVWPAWRAGFQWRACKSIFRILYPFSQNVRCK